MCQYPAVLFVCLGNICRSPLAEAAFRAAADEAGINCVVDSAGTGAYHIGEPPDPRSVKEAAKYGIDITHYQARQLCEEDFRTFDWIIGMDRSNMRNIEAIRPNDSTATIAMMLDLVPGREGAEVSDPWYGGEGGFAFTWEDVAAGADSVINKLR